MATPSTGGVVSQVGDLADEVTQLRGSNRELPSRLLYFPHTNLHYTESNAYRSPVTAIQITHMCRAFAHAGVSVTLVDPLYLGGATTRWHLKPPTQDAHPGNHSYEFRRLRLPSLLFDGSHAFQGLSPALRAISYLPIGIVWRMRWQLTAGDVLYTRCYTSASLLLALLRTLPANSRPRLVFEAHEDPSPLRASVLARVNGIVVITKALADQLGRRRLNLVPMTVEHDAVDLAAFTAEPRSKVESRRRTGLSGSDRIVVYCGALHGPDVEIMCIAAESLPADTRLVIVGGTQRDVDIWRARSSSARIQFIGYVDHDIVPAYLHAADVLLLPYTGSLRWAPYFSPLKLFEYMASERPIVATDLPAIREILSPGRNAVIVPPGDAAAIASAIRHLLEDDARAARLATAASEDVATHTWDLRAVRILEFVASLTP